MTENSDLKVLAEFIGILENLAIEYAIGGSIASSVYGEVRFTQDADISVKPFDRKAEDLLSKLTTAFYVSKIAMYDALRQRSSFNVIHIESAFKIDVFVRKESSFSREVISRRRFLKLDESIEQDFAVVSPEDIVLLKLQWFRDGGSVSERQWLDILSVIGVQKDNMDLEYLKKMSTDLGVEELLQKAFTEA